MTITEFLLARIAEDEAAAQVRTVSRRMVGRRMVEFPIAVAPGAWAWPPARVLAECAAKRAIVELHVQAQEWRSTPEDWCQHCGDPDCNVNIGYPCETLRILASVYSDHPDHSSEWAL